MGFKTGALLGFGAGYVLGSRAGRQRYEELRQYWEQFTGSPQVQQAAEKTKEVVGEQARRGLQVVQSGVESATPAVAESLKKAGTAVQETVSKAGSAVKERLSKDDDANDIAESSPSTDAPAKPKAASPSTSPNAKKAAATSQLAGEATTKPEPAEPTESALS